MNNVKSTDAFIIADHVDILGRSSLNDLILQVAGGRGELIEETIHSNILEYAKKVQIYDDGEELDA
jgi:phospholipid:diacylglycerol acyltransferase